MISCHPLACDPLCSLRLVCNRAMSDSLGYNVGGVYANGDNRGEIEVFVSRQGHVTTWHSDFMENLTLQLRGRWVLGVADLNTLPSRLRTYHRYHTGICVST